MGRPENTNGGWKRSFPRALADLLLDAEAVSQQIEAEEALIQAHVARRDKLQVALYRLHAEARRASESHEQAISGQRGALCGAYTLVERTMAELMAREPVPAA